jgi:hypothetical protein
MIRLIAAAALAACLVGCSKPAGPQRGAVEGKVTLDGTEVSEGSIAFYPVGNTKGPSAGGPVRGGRYSIRAEQGPVVGRNRVEIHASRKTGRKVQAPMSDPGVMTDEIAEAVPARYNTQSTQEIDVQPGSNVQDFAMASKASAASSRGGEHPDIVLARWPRRLIDIGQ